MKKIGYLGPAGTFSEKAAVQHTQDGTGRKIKLVSCENIPAAFNKLNNNEVHEIVVPVENSIEGTVNMTLDLLYLYPEFCITREIIIKVDHCLLSLEEDISGIKTVYSHPQALAQCQNFLVDRLPEARLVAVESTARASQLAADNRMAAAIASGDSAEKYGLNVLEEAIQDYRANVTCFWVVGTLQQKRTGEDKTSLVVALQRNKPGGLYSILGILYEYGINLTKIQSRPTKKELGEYLFYIDFIGHRDDANVEPALAKLRKKCSYFRILGSYPRGGNNL